MLVDGGSAAALRGDGDGGTLAAVRSWELAREGELGTLTDRESADDELASTVVAQLPPWTLLPAERIDSGVASAPPPPDSARRLGRGDSASSVRS